MLRKSIRYLLYELPRRPSSLDLSWLDLFRALGIFLAYMRCRTLPAFVLEVNVSIANEFVHFSRGLNHPKLNGRAHAGFFMDVVNFMQSNLTWYPPSKKNMWIE